MSRAAIRTRPERSDAQNSSSHGEAGAAESLSALHRRVLTQNRPGVTGLSDVEHAGQRFVAVALPVVQNGAVRYVLGARMGEAVWQRLSSATSVPTGANAALFEVLSRRYATLERS